MNQLNWGGDGFATYEGHLCFLSGDDGPPQKTAEQLAQEKADQAAADQKALINKTQPALDQYTGTGDVTKTPFYNALKTTGLESTANNYDNARSASRMKSRANGFGYEQPTVQGNDDALSAAEAHDLSGVPNAAAIQAAPLQLNAAAIQTGQAGLFNPVGYTQAGVSASNNSANNKTAMYLALLNAGKNAATYAPMIWS